MEALVRGSGQRTNRVSPWRSPSAWAHWNWRPLSFARGGSQCELLIKERVLPAPICAAWQLSAVGSGGMTAMWAGWAADIRSGGGIETARLSPAEPFIE